MPWTEGYMKKKKKRKKAVFFRHFHNFLNTFFGSPIKKKQK